MLGSWLAPHFLCVYVDLCVCALRVRPSVRSSEPYGFWYRARFSNTELQTQILPKEWKSKNKSKWVLLMGTYSHLYFMSALSLLGCAWRSSFIALLHCLKKHGVSCRNRTASSSDIQKNSLCGCAHGSNQSNTTFKINPVSRYNTTEFGEFKMNEAAAYCYHMLACLPVAVSCCWPHSYFCIMENKNDQFCFQKVHLYTARIANTFCKHYCWLHVLFGFL